MGGSLTSPYPDKGSPMIFTPTNLCICTQYFSINKNIHLFQINTPTSSIILNSLELKIKTCVLSLKDGTSMKPVIKVNQEDETISLNFEQELPTGEADLEFEFTGELNDKMKGFYRSNAST